MGSALLLVFFDLFIFKYHFVKKLIKICINGDSSVCACLFSVFVGSPSAAAAGASGWGGSDRLSGEHRARLFSGQTASAILRVYSGSPRRDGSIKRPGKDGPILYPDKDELLSANPQDGPTKRPGKDGPIFYPDKDDLLSSNPQDGPIMRPGKNGPFSQAQK